MSKPILTYFNGRGLAETIRLILAETQTDYEDRRLDSIADIKASLPFGQVPLYEDPSKNLRIAQSNAIARYLAITKGLYGATPEEGALCDMIVDGVNDLRIKLLPYFHAPAEKKAEVMEGLLKDVVPQWLGYFEALLKSNNEGKEFFVGNQLTYADITVFDRLTLLTRFSPTVLDNFPLLKAHSERIASRPNIAAWIAKRPDTPF